MDLSTHYMGLRLPSPIIVSASPLTNHIDNIRTFETQGAGAVVLRSLFEEQINDELESLLDQEDMYFWYPEAAEHIRKISKGQSLRPYLRLIEEAKKAVSIPVIASINCFSAQNWVVFSKNIQDAGADALELNVSTHLPYDEKLEQNYLENAITTLIKKVKEQVDIPVAVKIGPYYSNIIGMAKQLEQTGADGLVIFNRFYRPDIDINNLSVISDNYLSVPGELTHSLRWIGVLSRHVSCDLAASTGIHGYEGVAKQLLAGATVTQICSILYLRGLDYISSILNDLEIWMEKKGFESIDDFRGMITDDRLNSAKFEQIQFIKKNLQAM
ncbi:MAG: dihydroorotate dehydrogenase-like protein [Balneolales bacterium]